MIGLYMGLPAYVVVCCNQFCRQNIVITCREKLRDGKHRFVVECPSCDFRGYFDDPEYHKLKEI